jgi:hypothetical protein
MGKKNVFNLFLRKNHVTIKIAMNALDKMTVNALFAQMNMPYGVVNAQKMHLLVILCK